MGTVSKQRTGIVIEVKYYDKKENKEPGRRLLKSLL